MASAEVMLTAEDVRRLSDAAAKIEVHGARGTGREQYG